MGCFGQIKVFKKPKKHQNQSSSSEDKKIENDSSDLKKINEVSNVKMFTFNEMEAATNKFSGDSFLGEGGFGKVYKGHLDRIDEVVAIKQLNHSGMQGASEFFTEVALLGKLHHPNLVKLFGCCAEGNQKLLIYEYMPLGSLDRHLHDVPPDRPRLDWNTRMKIAAGAALGLDFLHNKAVPAVIYRDMKCSNILLGEGYHPKLSDFGLAKVAPMGDQTHISTRVMGTPGYCAPDYLMSGRLTVKSDVFCFGVALLEILTGRKAYERLKSGGERTLVEWARPLFKDRKKFPHMVDPTLQGQYPPRGLYQALAVAAMCVQEQADMRPDIADVVTALSFLASQVYNPEAQQPRTRVAPSTPQARSNTDKSDETESRKSI